MSAVDVRARAACRTADPEIFYDPRTVDQAKAYCHGCPVVAPCLTWALDIGDAHAVLGATTPGERVTPRDPASARRCARCERPLTPRGKPVPPGHAPHAGRGFCETCTYHRRRKAAK